MFRIVLIALLGFGLNAEARTLFIDLNNAREEIEALAAGAPGEIVVVPSLARIDVAARKRVLAANAKLEKLFEASHACASGKPPRDVDCATVFERIRGAELARLESTGNYTEQDLQAELSDIADRPAKKPFDMLVISGHHELGSFRGELAQLEFSRFAGVVQSLPGLFSSVNTVVLLGCETGTREMFTAHLAPMFPHVALVVGAEAKAPVRNDARNLAFIRKFDKSRKALLSARTVKQAEVAYDRMGTQAWPVSLLWRQKTLFLKKSVETLAPIQ
jgi:hypothetical protein